MSTKFTGGGVAMVNSHALNLVIEAGKVSTLISQSLANDLKDKGYIFASPSALNFLSTLECGVNYGSDIARNLGVSRQMVAKTVKDLCKAGYLEQVDAIGKQKKILFTATGELLMSDARQLLADMDTLLIDKINIQGVRTTIDNLTTIQNIINELSNSKTD